MKESNSVEKIHHMVEMIRDDHDLSLPDPLAFEVMMGVGLHSRVDDGRLLELLLSAGAPTNTVMFGEGHIGAFPGVIHSGSIRALEVLLASPGFDINEGDGVGWSPLWEAVAMRSDPEFLGRLVRAGVRLDFPGHKNLLHLAADSAGMEVIEFLLGFAIYSDTINRGYVEGDKKVSGLEAGDTPLITALHSSRALDEGTNTVNLLIRRGADVTIANDDGKTALMAAADGFDEELVQAILAVNHEPGYVNAIDKDGSTALSYAIERASYGYRLTEMYRVLTNAGAVSVHDYSDEDDSWMEANK